MSNTDDPTQPFPPDDSEPDVREAIPRESLVAESDDQMPDSQDAEPVEAALGDEGQGDLAPEDLVGDGTGEAEDIPGLRTSE